MAKDDLSSSPNRNRQAGHVIGSAAQRLQPAHRALWFGWSSALTGGFAIARMVQPDPRGFGTHTQLGLPGCAFLHWTGLPCPACGLTTCVAHLARGEWSAAWSCHPLGSILFPCLVATVPLAMYAAVRGSAACLTWQTWSRMQAGRVALVLACALFAQWLTRVFGLLLG